MSEVFKASRLTKGNRLFRTVIEVSDQSVLRRKRSWFTVNEMSIHLSKVASVRIDTGLFFADVLIESSGGSDAIQSHGHSKGYARRMKELIEQGQGRLAGQAKP